MILYFKLLNWVGKLENIIYYAFGGENIFFKLCLYIKGICILYTYGDIISYISIFLIILATHVPHNRL